MSAPFPPTAGRLNNQQRVVAARQRDRVLGRKDPAAELAVNANLGISLSNLTAFPLSVRNRPVTFAVTICAAPLAGALAATVFEFGSSTNGVRLNQLTDRLEFMAGNGLAASNDGVDGAWVHGVIPDGETRAWSIVASVNPGSGEIRMWVNGVLRIRAASVAAPLLTDVWADAGGGRMLGVNGTASARLGSPGVTTNLTQVQPLRVFIGQLPRQFD